MEKFLVVIMGHMVGDYLFQSDYLAANKGNDNYILLAHSVIYTFGVMLVAYLFNIEIKTLNLLLIGIIHLPVDYLKARGITTKWFGDKKALILDQLVHYITLLLLI